jgi:hypothetical protein
LNFITYGLLQIIFIFVRTNHSIMQKIIFATIICLFVFSLTSSAQCDNSLIDITKSENGGATYVKHFKVRFEKAKNPKKASKANFTILLNKGNHYRFNVHNDENKPGKAKLTLYDDYKDYGSNINPENGKVYPYFDFYCKKTNPYYISITFVDGEAGCAVGMLSYVKQFEIK